MPGSAKYRAAGLCSACGKERQKDRTKCTACLIKASESMKVWVARTKSEGKCTHCCKPNDNLPKVRCKACNEKARQKRVDLKRRVFEGYGGCKCVCCNESHIEFLSIDHINNDGAKHRREMAANMALSPRRRTPPTKPRIGVGYAFYRKLITEGFPSGFQVLCINCNFAKGKFGKCPHERERLSNSTVN